MADTWFYQLFQYHCLSHSYDDHIHYIWGRFSFYIIYICFSSFLIFWARDSFLTCLRIPFSLAWPELKICLWTPNLVHHTVGVWVFLVEIWHLVGGHIGKETTVEGKSRPFFADCTEAQVEGKYGKSEPFPQLAETSVASQISGPLMPPGQVVHHSRQVGHGREGRGT